MSFCVFLNFLFLPLLAFIVDHLVPEWGYLFKDVSDSGTLLPIILWACFLVLFISLAFKKIYKQPLWLTLIKAVAFIFVFSVVIRYVYNLILYFLVILFV